MFEEKQKDHTRLLIDVAFGLSGIIMGFLMVLWGISNNHYIIESANNLYYLAAIIFGCLFIMINLLTLGYSTYIYYTKENKKSEN